MNSAFNWNQWPQSWTYAHEIRVYVKMNGTWIQSWCEDERPESWTHKHAFSVSLKMKSRIHEDTHMNSGFMWRWTAAVTNIHTWIQRLCEDERLDSWTHAHEFRVYGKMIGWRHEHTNMNSPFNWNERPQSWTYAHEFRVYVTMNGRSHEHTHMNSAYMWRWKAGVMNIRTWIQGLYEDE